MKKNNLLLFALLTLCTWDLFAQLPSNDPHWQLIFQDDFILFDPSKWLIAEECDHGGEPQIYLAQNVTISNGNLVLTMKNENYNCTPNPQNVTSWACGNCNSGNHQYTSGWVETTLPNYVQYGYIEASIKLPYGKGFWPAFWTWTGSPSYNEIDIFEMIPGTPPQSCDNNNETGIIAHNQYIMTSNVHLQSNGMGCNEPYFTPTFINDYTQWHTYAIEWSPSKIIWYVDDKVVRILLNPGVVNFQRIILNFAMNPSVSPNNLTPFPAEMLIDYVKVYQKQKDCNNLINECVYNFITHDNKVKNSISIGGNGCSNFVNSGTNTTLRASGYISFEGDFTIPLGTEFYADANNECSNWISTNCSQKFNPCWYNFSNYDNQTKKVIELGGNPCTLNITSSSSLELKATDIIVLDKGVTIIPQTSNSIILEINNCTP